MSKYLSDIKAAILGAEQDFTTIRLSRAIILLAIPMVLEMLFESAFAIIDIYFVSQLGDNATSIVGLTESIMTLVYALGIGVAMGTTALVSRRIGEKSPKEASVDASQAIILSICLSLLVAIPGILFAENILYLMNASPEVVEQGKTYTRLMLGGNVLIMLLFVNNAIYN